MQYHVVCAFTGEPFRGNPAGVCLLDEPLPDELMQKIAAENRLSETAFLLEKAGQYHLRWFTPEVEIDLCGHATLATAYVLLNGTETCSTHVSFETASGTLEVTRENRLYWLDFPSRPPQPCPIPEGLEAALGARVTETQLSRDLVILLEDEKTLSALKPDMEKLKRITGPFGFIVTAKGDKCDFVSRFFAPNAGVDEDPVTGSSHTSLIPYWKKRLGKTDMTATQNSARTGLLHCRDRGERVQIGGEAVLYLTGEIVA